MVQLSLVDRTLEIMADLKAGSIRIGQDDYPCCFGVIADQRHLFCIVEDAKTVCDKDHRIQNGGKLDLVVLSLNDDSLCNMNHRNLLR